VSEELTFADGTKLSEDNADFIVLAEDDIDDQEFFIDAFSNFSRDIKIFTVNNGNKAIKVLQSLTQLKTPRLIILDYNLPEVNGADILKMLNQNQQFIDVPKVVWSTSSSPIYERMCLDFGAHAYLVKPSNIEGMENLAQEMFELCKPG
jgi:CheY-like chemotaxis protein